MNNWAIIGLGFISQKHLDAIADVGDKLVMACDIDESKSAKVPGVPFFTSWTEMIESPEFKEVDWVAICTPNYLHYSMFKACLQKGKKVLCEKPMVIETGLLSPSETFHELFTVLQLRYNPEVQRAREEVRANSEPHIGSMKIKIHRDEPYFMSWKGNPLKSGGLLINIGVHYFDLLIWIFGEPFKSEVYKMTDREASGLLTFLDVPAQIEWEIAINAPMDNQIRHFEIDGKTIDLTRKFENLHTTVYNEAIKGNGIPPSEAGKAIRLIKEMTK